MIIANGSVRDTTRTTSLTRITNTGSWRHPSDQARLASGRRCSTTDTTTVDARVAIRRSITIIATGEVFQRIEACAATVAHAVQADVTNRRWIVIVAASRRTRSARCIAYTMAVANLAASCCESVIATGTGSQGIATFARTKRIAHVSGGGNAIVARLLHKLSTNATTDALSANADVAACARVVVVAALKFGQRCRSVFTSTATLANDRANADHTIANSARISVVANIHNLLRNGDIEQAQRD